MQFFQSPFGKKYYCMEKGKINYFTAGILKIGFALSEKKY